MEFKFFNSKIIENLEHKFNLYYFYKGYDFHTLLSDSLDTLRESNPTSAIFIINFEESIIDKLNREGVHKIHKTETTKRHNLYMNRNSIFHLSSKVLLLDLITNKISSDMIEYLLIGNFKRIDTDSKEMFVLKYLVNNSPNTKFLLYNNESCNFIQDLNSLIRSKIISKDNFKINFFPRNHIIIEKTIDYTMNIKGIQIFEYNLEYKKIEDLQQILCKLYDNCRMEISRLAQVKDIQIEQIFHIDKMLSEFSSLTINELITAGYFNFKQRCLIKDCFILKRFLVRLEYLDFPTMLLNFNSMIRYSDDSSYFRYKDSETMFLIESFTEALKKKIFYVSDHRVNSGINQEINNSKSLLVNYTGFSQAVCNGYAIGSDAEELIKKYEDTLQLRNERNNFILRNFSINISNDLVRPSPKLESLLSILNSFNSDVNNKEGEVRNILIIGNSQNTVDNLKEFLFETYSKTLINSNLDSNQKKSNSKSNSYYEKKLRNFLITKSEFLKRQNIIRSSVGITGNSNNAINTNSLNASASFPPHVVENFLLHKLCIDLCYKYDKENINLFEKIMKSFSALVDDNLPSEIDITEEVFSKMENTMSKGRVMNIIPPHNVYVENFNFDENLIKFKEAILLDNISHVIFYDFNLELLRYTECIINTYEECKLGHIYILNTVNSYNFKKEKLKVINEFEICKKIYNDYKQFSVRKQFQSSDIPKKNSSGVSIDNTKQSSHLSTKNNSRSNKNILIDFREMSSKLPFYLYDFGFNLVVGGLDIGDYITSNSVCIERKSITTGDLFESLKSGRLVNQIIKMQRYYEHLIILCEFEDDLIFMQDRYVPLNNNANNVNNSTYINNNNNFRAGISDTSLTKPTQKSFFKQKFLYKKFLELKTMCNKIHILWSKNPKMTASLLNMLKNKFNDFLDIQRCLNCGNKKEGNNFNSSMNLSQSGSAANNVKNSQTKIFDFLGKNKEQSKDITNSDAKGNTDDNLNVNLSRFEEDLEEFDPNKQMGILIEKFLRNLDGINLNNFDMIYKNFKNLKEFVNCSREKFQNMFGKNGNKIFYFFNSRFNKNKFQG